MSPYEDMKKQTEKNSLFESRNIRLFNTLVKSMGLKERIEFDEPEDDHIYSDEEEVDENLLKDVVEMYVAGEKEEDIEEMLIRGEGMSYPESRKYIYLAKKKGSAKKQ